MASLDNYPVLNFSGGIRRDKSFLEMDRTELADARNVELDERGRVRVRRGSQQLGQTLTGSIEHGFLFHAGSNPSIRLVVNNNATTGVLSILQGARLTAAVALADVTLTVASNVPLTTSGTVEIDGDLIAYTAKSGTTGLTGVTGITSTHAIGAAVNQWATITQSGTAVDGRQGIYYCKGSNSSGTELLFINGRPGNIKTYDGTSVADVSGEPAGLFITNYRDRLYVAGDGSGGTNGQIVRVSFSASRDGTAWTATDIFDVYGQSGSAISGLFVLKDLLGIFKLNAIFSWDDIELKERVQGVGAYNQRVIQELNGLVYTFCPTGIYETNLFSSKEIGEPVREYWKNFLPTYDAVSSRVCTNTFSWKFRHSYYLYLGDITNPTFNDVVLEYDTSTKSWVVHPNAFTNITGAFSMGSLVFGDNANSSITPGIFTGMQAVIFGDSSGKAYRLFENRYVDSTSTIRGGDIFQDMVSDSGSPVSAMIETPLYDMGHPTLFKTPKRLRVYAERGVWSFEWRVENENQITQYKPLGVTTKTNQTLDFPSEAQGYRIGLRVAAVNTASQSVLNGFIFEEITVKKRANK